MSPETRLDIEFELGQLKLIATKLASISPSQTSLSEHETAFVAVQIHSFYNGIERALIMLTAWQETTGDWHASLLRQFLNDPSFPYSDLRELMKFRHVFRHAYFFDLKPERIEELKGLLLEVWPKFETWIPTKLTN